MKNTKEILVISEVQSYLSVCLKGKPEGYLRKSMEPDAIVKYIENFFEKRKRGRL